MISVRLRKTTYLCLKELTLTLVNILSELYYLRLTSTCFVVVILLNQYRPEMERVSVSLLFKTASNAVMEVNMKLLLHYIAIQIKSLMEYRISFLFLTLGQFVLSFTIFLGTYVLFQRFHVVAGYSFEEVVLCSSIILLSFSLAELAGRGFDMFQTVLGNGQFDRMLVRPRGLMFQVLASRMEFSRLGRIIQALLMLGYAVSSDVVAWKLTSILILLSMVLGGTFFFFLMYVIRAALCFFTVESIEILNIFTDGGREFGGYPLIIYGKEVLLFLTVVIPFALVQYYPFLYLTGRSQQLWYGALPIVSMLFAIPAYAIWRAGLRYYKSTGS